MSLLLLYRSRGATRTGGDDAWANVGGPIVSIGSWKKKQKEQLPSIAFVEKLAEDVEPEIVSSPTVVTSETSTHFSTELENLLDEFRAVTERIETLERIGQQMIEEALLRKRIELAKQILAQEEEMCLLLLMMQ